MTPIHPLSMGGETYALLDANVLLPPRLSDILFDLHLEQLFFARWTHEIESEFLRNFSKIMASSRKTRSIPDAPDQKEIDIKKARQRLSSFQGAVKSFEVFGHDQPFIEAQIPSGVHAGDRHVAAAALALLHYSNEFDDLRRNKIYLVSNNLKHLSVAQMGERGVSVVSPGDFIDLLMKAESSRVNASLVRSWGDLRAPSYTKDEFLEILESNGANESSAQLKRGWGLTAPF